jgi:hypothetical protein
MLHLFSRKNSKTLSVIIVIVALALAAIALSSKPHVQAQTEPTVLVTGYNGTSINYTLTQLEALPNVTMYGGFYQQNQQIVNNGLWTGVDVLTLCDQVGGITPTCTISVRGTGTNTFTYNMIQNGLDINQSYKTCSNLTGAAQNQTQRMYIILAYVVNGTDLPASEQPPPRFVGVGPEGLVIVGSGGRGVTQVTVTNSQPNPTPSPSTTATTEPTTNPTTTPQPTSTSPPPTTSPTASPITTPTTTPNASPNETSTQSSAPTQQTTEAPTTSPTPTLEPQPEKQIDTSLIVAFAAGTVIVVVIAGAIIIRRRKP